MWFSRRTTQWHHALLLLCIMVLGRAPVASSLSKASIPGIYSALLADSSASCNDSSASENAYSLLLHDNLPASSNETVDNDNDSVPSNEKEAGSKYEAAVQRVRTRVRMRDTDIVLATFPKSGTHFLAAAVTALLDNTTGAYVRAKTAEAARLGKIPPLAANSFHGFPVFTMMPDDRGIPVPEDTLEFVESFPEDVPRIFMVRDVSNASLGMFLFVEQRPCLTFCICCVVSVQTHEPVPDLELALSEGTRVINLIRDPRAVCASLFRTFRTMRMESWATHRPENVPEVFLEPIAADFVGLGNSKSGIHFPARAVDDRENPFPYTWSAHVGGWYDFGKKRPADTYRILDFDDDVRSSKKAARNTVRKLADFLLGEGAVSEVRRMAHMLKVFHCDARIHIGSPCTVTLL